MSGRRSSAPGEGFESAYPRPFCCSVPAFPSLDFCGFAECQSRTRLRMVHPFERGAGRCLVSQFVRSTGHSRGSSSRCHNAESSTSRASNHPKAPDNSTGSDARPRDALLTCCDYLLRRLLPSVLSESLSGHRTQEHAPFTERTDAGNARCSRCGRLLLVSEPVEQVKSIHISSDRSTDCMRQPGSTGADITIADASPTTFARGSGGTTYEGGLPSASDLADTPPETGNSSLASKNPQSSAAIAYSFFADRLRAIRQDAVRQRLNTADLFILLLQCARFHLFAEYFWSGGIYASTRSAEPAPSLEGFESPHRIGRELVKHDHPAADKTRVPFGSDKSHARNGVEGRAEQLPACTPPAETFGSRDHLLATSSGAQEQEVSPEATFKISGFSPSLNRFLLSSCLVQLLGIIVRESRRFRLLLRRKRRDHGPRTDCGIGDAKITEKSSERSGEQLQEFARGLGVESSEIDEAVSLFLLSQTLAVPVQPTFKGQERSIFVIQEITRALGIWWSHLPWSALAIRMAIQASSGVEPRRSLLRQETAPVPFLLRCAVYPSTDRLRAGVLAEVKAASLAAAPGTLVSMKQLMQLMACSRADVTSLCLRLGAGEPVYSKETTCEKENCAEEGTGRETAGRRAELPQRPSWPAAQQANNMQHEGLPGKGKRIHQAHWSSGISDADQEAASAPLGAVAEHPHRREVVSGIRFRRTDENAHLPGHALPRDSTQKELGRPTRFSELLASVGSDAWRRSTPSFVVHAPGDVEELRNIFAWPPPVVM
ncbi:conserved hypothetical protein [Neospora caninum Liverpool]|uniref:SAC3/GANP/THP3 conserved domain-containing protein n=1 Tax=Neospora caninum (strain Liverpool) TaxID=572307 RepID=F0VA08_NEOCL|nr:conserved hypothetical protein [Neospora caninum Liverpool]CBZ50497.1 conserved hypothetical protein [Neospora caninum Liverpool]CEL65107.1 TPA: hypothetical protein BN1204_009660 [Neospora caninum Liverpool]|eukprot:XP_003880530.1 conserved hypothetical protein [Neospora caninum Liverpool]